MTNTFLRVNGEKLRPTDPIKDMFLKQWVSGNFTEYMQTVKGRVKDVYDIDLIFTDKESFLDQLIKHGLLKVIEK